ncbi:DNA damage-inducible protein 1-like [Silene latifolia]|uniref:DNA damage-inducible protein 1-like n=1 Tax=Silene latifolia TaxID=37657 RepID=UPI003D782766
MVEACSAHILNKMPTKLGDLRIFSIPCVVGGVPISRALCDLGASVSDIPLKVARKFGIHSLVPTTMTLQLADRSVKRPLGVLEDIPVKVGKYLIPADFVVLDIPKDSHTPIILGRPLLATGGVIIDMRNGRLTFRIESDKVEFNLPNLIIRPQS